MDAPTAISLASLVIAVFALVAVLFQVNLELSVEQRRKGKTDKLAIGDWAISWPQPKLTLHFMLSPFGIKSPWGDPRLLSVPFITVAGIEDYLRAEAKATSRSALARRMKQRLVRESSAAIATGGGSYSGRMYAVRETTRKRSEACWSDALDMCNMSRKHWNLTTSVSAQACDGAIRPAHAVTNLHSLWGLARVMGMRSCDRQGTKVTFSNGGASIYLDQYAGPDRPTRLAHFSGSPNGRYRIIDEMSQHTGASIYADTLWSSGFIPDLQRLRVDPLPTSTTIIPSKGKKPSIAKGKLRWPEPFLIPDLARTGPLSLVEIQQWTKYMLPSLRNLCGPLPPSVTDPFTRPDILQFTESRSDAVLSCIRSYPSSTLSMGQLEMCNRALLWCVTHWWLSPYEWKIVQYRPGDYPRLPDLGIDIIGCEYVTSRAQANEWCDEAVIRNCTTVTEACWSKCYNYVCSLSTPSQAINNHLTAADHLTLLKIIQCWRLFLVAKEDVANDDIRFFNTAQLALLTMALVSIASDSSKIGDHEENKAMEIELG
ncbi:hypothetical protein TWF730_009041 [Orbilia blumenaviensis]|uniref:Uncharacterized protein n=1 Tax=Orbilia blumenaviensis TaxID=1796055 RepID=A0AAV9UX72_9PEZI